MNDGIIASWADALNIAWHTIADRIINFIPNLLGAILILIIGWILAVLLDRLVDQLMRVIGLQSLAEKMKLEDGIKKVGIKKDFAGLVGAFVKWVIIIVAFLAAAEALQLTQVVEFLNSILNYVPNVAAAAGILLIGVVLANFLADVVGSVTKGIEIGYSELLALLVRGAILVFTVLAALVQLNVASYLIQTLFTGFVALFAIAGGLAFGLGGKDAAAEFVDKVKKDIQKR
ncbi:MAG TPA: hypothetical protein VJJ80_00140 [Patescibacteria group bacterium]|nr:hypothetical protein [Patescibacteria group bacterium]